jgi:hypothetical protein
MPKTPEIVDVDFIAPRHLAGGGAPPGSRSPCTGPAAGATATTP